jgi:hypothetical protein
MSVDTRAREAARRAHIELASVDVPDLAAVLSRVRRRRGARTVTAALAVVVGIAALVVPLVTWVDDDGTPSVVGAPAGTAPARDGKQYIVDIDSEAVAAADHAGVNLTRLTRKSLALIGQRLPELERVVRVEVDPSRVVLELGLGSSTDRTTGDVVISVDPDRMDKERLRTWVPALLAREAFNSVRVREGPEFGATLGDRMVGGSLGDAFVSEMFPATPRLPWADALGEEEQRLAWARARPVLEQVPPDEEAAEALVQEWFQGRGVVPRWAGFTLGFEIVTSYLESHPEATVAGLVAEPAASILAESGYDPAPPDPNRPRCYRDLAQTREVPCGDWEATFDAAGVVPEPGRCYVVGALSGTERRCRQ